MINLQQLAQIFGLRERGAEKKGEGIEREKRVEEITVGKKSRDIRSTNNKQIIRSSMFYLHLLMKYFSD